MIRREAIKKCLTGTGAVVTISSLDLLVACGSNPMEDPGSHFFTSEESSMVNRLVDLIIPATQTASASEAGVPSFIDIALAECFDENVQSVFKKGLQDLMQSGFSEGTKVDQANHLLQLEEQGNAFFLRLKALTLIGYFTSERGVLENYTYQPVPGEYKGCEPFQLSDKVWRGNSV